MAGSRASAQDEVVAWGYFGYGQNDVPPMPPGLSYVQIAAGGNHTAAIRSDGSVVAWGKNDYGQCNVPALPAGSTHVEVAGGGDHTVARRSDGSVVAWGDNGNGQYDVPALPAGLTYVEVAAGRDHTLGLRSDGSVVAWGANGEGQCNVPALPDGLTYAKVSAGSFHNLASRSDGSLVAWGWNNFGQCDVPALPAGLTYVEFELGEYHTVARRSDNSVVAWGDNSNGQLNVPALPAGWTYVEVDAGRFYTVARRINGSVVAWGENDFGQCDVPALPAGLSYGDIAAGWYHMVAVTGPPPLPPSLTGLVRNIVTGTPVSGAAVVVPNEPQTVTAMDGMYTIYTLPSGSVTATASAPGFNPVTNEAVIVTGDTATLDFDLLPTFSDLGFAMPGSLGPPALSAIGPLAPATPIQLTLSNSKPFSIAPLVVGISRLTAPFKGGVMVPKPDLVFPMFTDFFGAAVFGGLWPHGVPSGLTTYFQWWVKDPAGPQGFAASNGLSATTP